MKRERGLVISPPVEAAGAKIWVKNTDLDPQELRFSLLFWDRLDQPSFNLVHINSGPEAQFLEDAKVLHRTKWFSAGGNLVGDYFVEAHIGVFRSLDEKEPGIWSLATGERSLSFPNAELVGRGALVELHRAIPVPDKDVPLQDILEFRVKRKPELQALRHHLESIYQRVVKAGDGPLAMLAELEALQAAVVDHIKVSREIGFKLRPASLNASLNLVNGVRVAATTFVAGLPPVSALLTGAAASINIGPGTALSWGKSTGTPFRYVSAFHNALF